MEQRPYFFDLDPDDLAPLLSSWEMPRYRARQVLEWVYKHHVAEPWAMANLSKSDRQLLADRLRFTTGHVVEQQVASDGTTKLLMQWPHRTLEASGGGDRYPWIDLRNNRGDVALPQPNDSRSQTECVLIPSSGRDDFGRLPKAQTRQRRTACISSQIGCPVGCRFCASGLGGLEGNLSHGQIVEQVWRLASLPRVEPGGHLHS